MKIYTMLCGVLVNQGMQKAREFDEILSINKNNSAEGFKIASAGSLAGLRDEDYIEIVEVELH